MRIDVSSDSFDPLRDYTRVLLQQGRPLLDRDWNEHTAIVLNQLRAVARAVYGYHGGPAGGACGFVPFDKDGQLWLRKGQYTIDGQLYECDRDYAYTEQKYCQGKALGEGIHLVYLEAFEKEVTAAEDPRLLDSALAGVDLAARGQAIWRVAHCDWSTTVDTASKTFCQDAVVQANKWLKAKRDEQLNSAGSLGATDELKNAVKDQYNQLLRLECHQPDTSSGLSEWKLSTDNGFALFEIAKPVAGQKKATVNLGNLTSWKPISKGIIELLTLEQVRFDLPGLLTEVQSSTDSDDQTPESANQVDLVLEGPLPEGACFLRVWRQKFALPKSEGVRAGDYWQYAMRDAKPDFSALSLKRPIRHYIPLAVVQAKDTKVDVLARFQRVVGVPWRDWDEAIDGHS